MIEYFALILAIPLGILMAKITKNEKQIYKNPPYFPIIISILLILTAIFISLNKQITLTLAFMLIAVFTWQKA